MRSNNKDLDIGKEALYKQRKRTQKLTTEKLLKLMNEFSKVRPKIIIQKTILLL